MQSDEQVVFSIPSPARWLPDHKPVSLVVFPVVVLPEDPLPPPVVSDEAGPPTLGERFLTAALACGNLADFQRGCWGMVCALSKV